ncbi:PhoP regulatory network YrbL family protein [Bordetella bronchiseptica]
MSIPTSRLAAVQALPQDIAPQTPRDRMPAVLPVMDVVPAATDWPPFVVVDLLGATLLATGSERDVYQHPGNAALLIKIVNRARINEPGRRRPWHKKFHREDAHRVFITELVEYISTTVQLRQADGNTLLARIAGLALTSAGLGLVVEKIVDAEGKAAPTLAQVVSTQGFGPQLREQLRAFFLALIEAHVIFNDVSARNIVVGRNATGQDGLFLVDGFGPKQLLPLYAWSKTLNRRRLLRKYEDMVRKLARLGDRLARQAEQPLPGDGARPPR